MREILRFAKGEGDPQGGYREGDVERTTEAARERVLALALASSICSPEARRSADVGARRFLCSFARCADRADGATLAVDGAGDDGVEERALLHDHETDGPVERVDGAHAGLDPRGAVVVERVGGGEDLRAGGDLVARQAIRSARAIPPLVQVTHRTHD